MANPSTHSELCDIAARWLKKPLSKRGMGCQVAFTETKTSYLDGESPDAIGFRVSSPAYGGGSTVIECKTSRADFLRDAKKAHRVAGAGMGRFRYFLCPDGLISPEELPQGWGLLYVRQRGTISVVCGAILAIGAPGIYDCQHDALTETLLLANLLHRVGNADKLNARLRAADRTNQSLQRQLDQKSRTIDHLNMEITRHHLAKLTVENQKDTQHA